MNSFEFIGVMAFLLNVIAYITAFYAIYRVRKYLRSFEHAFFVVTIIFSLPFVFTENFLFFLDSFSFSSSQYSKQAHYILLYKSLIIIAAFSFGFFALRSAMIVDYNHYILIIIALLAGVLFADLSLTFTVSIYHSHAMISYLSKTGAAVSAITSLLLMSIPFGLQLYETLQETGHHTNKYRQIMLYEFIGHSFLVIAFVILFIQRVISPYHFPFTFFLSFWAMGIFIISIGIIQVPLPYRIKVIGHVTAVMVYSLRTQLIVSVYQNVPRYNEHKNNNVNAHSLGIIGVNSLLNDILGEYDKRDAELVASSPMSNLVIIPRKEWLGAIQLEKRNTRLARYVLKQLLLFLSHMQTFDEGTIIQSITDFVGFLFQPGIKYQTFTTKLPIQTS